MNLKKEIKSMFAKLSATEQQELLKELSASLAASATSIADFAQKHQKRYGRSIEFKVSQTGPDHCPTG